MATLMPERRATLALAVSSVAWGLSWLPLKALAAQGIEGLWLTLIAATAATLPLTPLVARQRGFWRGSHRALAGIALLGGYAQLSFVLALIAGDVVRVMVLFYLLPVWAAVGGWLWLGEPVTPPRRVAVVLAVVGAFLALGGPAMTDAPLAAADALALTCGIAFAANNLVFRALPAVPLASKVVPMLLGAAGLAGAGLLVGLQPPPGADTGGSGVGLAALYGVGWLLLATWGSQWGITHLPAARGAVLLTLELVTAVASATLLGAETWSLTKAVGVTLILTAALLEARG
jgi:drug/metabolite transporter (DMT)-like permease